jgi:hypothetical protein
MPDMQIYRTNDDRARLVVQKLMDNGAFSVEIFRSEQEHVIILAREPIGPRSLVDLRWHISMSHADRLPEWSELVEVAHVLRPGVVFCIGVPPKSWWMNVHEFTLHLWELKDDNLIGEYRANARGHRPT